MRLLLGDEMETPSFGQRFALAFSAFFKIIFDAGFAAGVLAVRRQDGTAEQIEVDPKANDTMPHEITGHQELIQSRHSR